MSTVGSRYSAHPTHSRPATCRAASEATKAIATSVVSYQGSWSDRGGQPCRLPKSGYDGMLRSGPVIGPLVMTGLCLFFFLSWGHEKQEVLAMIRTCATGAASTNMPNILTGPSAYCRQWRILSARSGQRTTVCRLRHGLIPAGVHWKRVRHFCSGMGGSCIEGRNEGSLGLYKIMV